MAENVEFRSEEYAAELDVLKQTRLFTQDELKSIQAKRKSYEYTIERDEKRKEDFLLYIQHEMDVLKVLRERKDVSPLRDQLNGLIDRIVSRISKLFNLAILRFANDERLLLSYLNFCKQLCLRGNASVLLSRMLVLHVNKPHLWHLAAMWELEEMNSVDSARKIYIRGLGFHPTDEKLYLQAFKFELNCAQLLRKKSKKEIEGSDKTSEESPEAQISDYEDSLKNGHLAELIFISAMKQVSKASFAGEFLNIAKEYNFTTKIQLEILNCLKQSFTNEEVAWDILAKHELDFDQTHKEQKKLRHKIESCVAVYNSAVQHIPTEKMWSFYIDTLLKLAKEEHTLSVFKSKLLKKAFDDAHSSGLLHERYYNVWVSMLQKCGKVAKVESVLESTSARISRSIDIWHIKLRFHISHSDEEKILRVFKEAVCALQNNLESVSLWKMFINYYQDVQPSKVSAVFQDGLSRGSAVAATLKPLYIEWAASNEGIQSARKIYDAICRNHPFSLDLHKKMTQQELKQPILKADRVRKCYDSACEQFGSDNIDIWLEYIKFEHEKGDSMNVSIIYQRALMTLTSVNVDHFITAFNLLKTNL